MARREPILTEVGECWGKEPVASTAAGALTAERGKRQGKPGDREGRRGEEPNAVQCRTLPVFSSEKGQHLQSS